MRRALLLVVLAPMALLPIAPVACSSKAPNPPMTPYVTPGDGGAEAGAPLVAADAGVPVVAADAGAANTVGMIVGAVDAMVDAEVAKIATKAAPGMALEGSAYRETLGPNGHLNAIVTLQPSRCYTIIGYSPKEGVTQLDLQLLAPPLFNIPTNRAPSPKNEAIIGKGKEALCPVSLVPIPYKVDAVASKGTGRVGVYLFSRNK